MPTFGSLFAGIGGIDLGLERAGWECRWQVEIDPFCRHVLEHHWPAVPRYGDIRAIDWSDVERTDLLAGGFPCQPVSSAGRRKAQDDARWLWPEFARAIRALRPRLVLIENVPGLLSVNGGRAFGEVLGDLAESGYDAEWDCVPAAAVGAPHLRDRVWIVANADGSGRVRGSAFDYAGEAAYAPRPATSASSPALADATVYRRSIGGNGHKGRNPHSTSGEQFRPQPRRDGIGHGAGLVADADSERWHGRAGGLGSGWWAEPADGSSALADADLQRGVAWNGESWSQGVAEFGSEPPLADAHEPGPQGHRGFGGERDGAGEWAAGSGGGADDGWWLVEPAVGRVAHGVPARVDRLRALGNAVVPQVVEVIGRALMQAVA